MRSELEDLDELLVFPSLFFFRAVPRKKRNEKRRKGKKRTSFRAFLRVSSRKGSEGRLAGGGKINGKPREPFQTERFRCSISGTALTIES